MVFLEATCAGLLDPLAALWKNPFGVFSGTQAWKDVSPAEIGYDRGFYDYAAGTDGAVVPDKVFAELEREFPPHREVMAAHAFADWQKHKKFLLKFAEVLAIRSPLGMKHSELEARSLRGGTVLAVSEDRRRIDVDSLDLRPLPERAVRNFTVSQMLQRARTGQGGTKKLDWCLRYTEAESEGFCTTDQAVFAEGPLQVTDEHRRVSEELLLHPETLVSFPLCWQACLFGSPRKFDKAYDRVRSTQDVSALRAKQKQAANLFVVSPVVF